MSGMAPIPPVVRIENAASGSVAATSPTAKSLSEVIPAAVMLVGL